MATGLRSAVKAEDTSAKSEDSDESLVEDFFARLEFFPVSLESALRILVLSQELSDNYIDNEIATLARTELTSAEQKVLVVDKNWMSDIIKKVSGILFHEEPSVSEDISLSEEEMVPFFQKSVSQKVYNHLNMLSYTPHALSGKPFSITEELTDGIAENVGLGLYNDPETPATLRENGGKALLDLAWEFQYWLLQRGGYYPAPWGVIDTVGTPKVADEDLISRILRETETEGVSKRTLMLIPDVERRKEPRSLARHASSAARAEAYVVATADSVATAEPAILIESATSATK